MNKLLFALFIAVFSISALADLTPREERFVDMMMSGNLNELKRAAKGMHSARNTNTDVLDIAAEALAQLHADAIDAQIDTLAWICNALGQSANGRYHDLLSVVVVDGSHKKLRKYAKKALRQVGEPTENQYKKGMIKLKHKTYI